MTFKSHCKVGGLAVSCNIVIPPPNLEGSEQKSPKMALPVVAAEAVIIDRLCMDSGQSGICMETEEKAGVRAAPGVPVVEMKQNSPTTLS